MFRSLGLGPLLAGSAGEHQAGNGEQSVDDPQVQAAPLHGLAPPVAIQSFTGLVNGPDGLIG